jgi:lipopolysaccharide transport system ATP-binding protein
MSDEVLIDAENIGKKFCRSLKRSLWYGVQDIAKDLSPFNSAKAISSHQEPGPTPNQQPETTSQFQNLGISTFQNFLPPPLRAEEFWALRDVSFQLRRGECLGLIGHNGAGKSTLLKILNGLIRPDTGRLTIRGKVGALIELSAGFNPVLTGRENIYNRGAVLGFSREEIAKKFDAIVDFAEIGDFLDMPVQNYSSGMQVRLGFAVSVQMEPDILLLDEVLAVGDIAFRFKGLNAMGDLLRKSAVIFVSHSMPQIYRVSSEVMVLQRGQVAFHGREVGAGIDRFHGLQPAADPHVNGSGEASLVSCRLVCGNSVVALGESLAIRSHIPFRIELGIRLAKGIETVRVQVVIWNQEMIPVADIVGPEGKGYLLRVTGHEDFASVVLEVPALPLNGGRHMLSVCLVSEDQSRVFTRHDNAAVLDVSNSNASGAHFVVAGRWRRIDAIPVRG